MLQYQLLNGLMHAIIFFMGAAIGSFLNVVIYRLPRGISVNNPRRSFCPSCNAAIPIYQNIPIVSWLLLRGKCSQCKKPISPRYLGVELLVGLLFYAVFWKFSHDPDLWPSVQAFANAGPFAIWNKEIVIQWGPQVLCLWIFVSLLVAGTFIDFEHFILPHEITIGGTVAGLICATWVPELVEETTHLRGFLLSFGSAALGLGGLWLVVELGKLAFGRKRHAFKEAAAWSVTQPDDTLPPVVTLQEEKYDWADLFSRANDRLLITCPQLTVNGQSWQNVIAELGMETLKVRPALASAAAGKKGGAAAAVAAAPAAKAGASEDFALEGVTELHGTTTQVVIPREAMGFGDVLFLMMIGSFAGWQAVLFTILCASVLGSLFAGFWRLIGRNEWGAKIPFGPYLAAGALLWIFYGPQTVDWYMSKVMSRGL